MSGGLGGIRPDSDGKKSGLRSNNKESDQTEGIKRREHLLNAYYMQGIGDTIFKCSYHLNLTTICNVGVTIVLRI